MVKHYQTQSAKHKENFDQEKMFIYWALQNNQIKSISYHNMFFFDLDLQHSL